MAKTDAAVAAVAEDYYQISQTILESFPKFRIPLNLFLLNEEAVTLRPFYTKDARLTAEQIEQMHEFCAAGNLFVSRSDFPVYSKHIVKQLDLILVDENLKEGEIADLVMKALSLKLTDFFDQPVKIIYDLLFEDCMVFTEYLWTDKHRIKTFMRRLHTGEHSLMQHSLNSMIVGLWLLMREKGEELTRKELDNYCLGLILHDVGMTKVPAFITGKTTPLKPEEKDKIPPHVLTGGQVLAKLEVVAQEIKAMCLQHHERLDGSGYPQKASGKNLTWSGMLCAVADSFSAMIQKRPYAPAKPLDKAAQELMQDSKHYDKNFTAKLCTAIITKQF